MFKLLIILFLSLTFASLSYASHDKKLPSVVAVGTVYCDTCFQHDFSIGSHFISDALVAVECKDGNSIARFKEEVKTNEHGEFKVKLPFTITKNVRIIKGCTFKLISSSEHHCVVASISTSSSLMIKTRKQGEHIFSAGIFSFQPTQKPNFCNKKQTIPTLSGTILSTKSSDKYQSNKEITDTFSFPPIPFLPPFPPIPFLPPFPPIPFLPPLPPNPFLPPSPLIPSPIPPQSPPLPSPSPLIPSPIPPQSPPLPSPSPLKSQPNKEITDAFSLPPIPFLPPLPPIPFLPPFPPIPFLPPFPPIPFLPPLPPNPFLPPSPLIPSPIPPQSPPLPSPSPLIPSPIPSPISPTTELITTKPIITFS